jgi:hypothetical protein
MKAYENAMPGLLTDGQVSHDEAKALLAYYGQVDQMNRVLDQAHDARSAAREDLSIEEQKRLTMKALHVSSQDKYYKRLKVIFDARAPLRVNAQSVPSGP